MNAQSGPSSQVINILDTPQSSNTLHQHAMTDSGFLEGIPGGMFDWGEMYLFFYLIVLTSRRSMGHLFFPVECWIHGNGGCIATKRTRTAANLGPRSLLATGTFVK